MSTLVDKARDDEVLIVWFQYADEQVEQGSDAWQFVPELVREESEPLIHKHYADAFDDTGLEDVLAEGGVGHLVVAGAQTDECIRSTIHGAFTRGYDVTLVGDAHTKEDHSEWGGPPPESVIAHTNLYWTYHHGPGRQPVSSIPGTSISAFEGDAYSRPSYRAVNRQNSLPSGSAMTAQLTSPWPMSIRVAPSETRRSISVC